MPTAFRIFSHSPHPCEKTADELRRTSLDTTSSMNTAETSSTDHIFTEFPDCSFAGHPAYRPIREEEGLRYLAERRDSGELVTICLLERGAGLSRHVVEELLLHRQCTGHPLFVKLRDVFLTPLHLAIVTERLPEGSSDVLSVINERGALPEDLTRCLFQQLAVGMAFLHSLGASHREMKLDSKLLVWESEEAQRQAQEAKGGEVVVALAAEACAHSTRPTLKKKEFAYFRSDQTTSDPRSALVSLPYTAPEVLLTSRVEGCAADVWGLGVALYKMKTGLYPFERPGDDPRTAVQVVVQRIARVDFVIPENLSCGLKDLLGRMLVLDPEERASLDVVISHPWVKQDMPEYLAGLGGARRFDPGQTLLSEEELRCIVQAAQAPVRTASDIETLADDLLNEEEADDLLEELDLR